MSTPEDRITTRAAEDRTQVGSAPAPARSQLEGLGKRKKRTKAPKAGATQKPSRASRRAARKATAPPRTHPPAYKLIAAVALIVALDILLFFAIGYALGKQIL